MSLNPGNRRHEETISSERMPNLLKESVALVVGPVALIVEKT
jgi:hypothetical protein